MDDKLLEYLIITDELDDFLGLNETEEIIDDSDEEELDEEDDYDE